MSLKSPGRRYTRLLTIASALLLTGTSTSLQSQDLPPPDTNAILKQLDQAANESKNSRQKRRSAALSAIQSGATSGPGAVDLYLHAVDGTTYRTNHRGFIDWNRSNEDLLRSTSFQNAVLLQMRYLILGLERDEEHNAYSQVEASLAYLSILGSQLASRPDPAARTYPESTALMNQALGTTEVVQWLQIADLLPDGSSFADAPGNYQDIMEKNVRVPLRKMHDKRLPGTWDSQMAVEAAIVTATGDRQQAETFNNIHLPDLLFKKAQDTAAIGQPNRALGDVMLLLQTYPNHPSVKEWIDYARTELTNAPGHSVTTDTPAEAKESDPLRSSDTNATNSNPDASNPPGVTAAPRSSPPATNSPFGSLVPP